MTVRRPPLEQTLERIQHATITLTTTHPNHKPTLEQIRHTATQLAHWLPRATEITTRGDGLRSPSLQPHRGHGGHGDPVLALIEADWGETGTQRRGPAGRLDRAGDHIRTAHKDLTHAHRLPDPTYALDDAATGLTRALGLVQTTIPKSYDLTKLRLANPPACTNCLTHGHHTEAGPGMQSLCRWCYDTTHAIGRHPDAELVEAHHSGRRITRALMDRLDREAERRRIRHRTRRKASRR